MPEKSPARQHQTDNQEWGTTEALLWRLLWAVGSLVNGLSKESNIFTNMPLYPWQRSSSGSDQKTWGSFGDHSPEEVLDYLDSL